jgi:hypothetical protein
MINCEGHGRKGLWLIVRYCSRRGIEENHNDVTQDNQPPGLYLNPEPPLYKAGVNNDVC